MWQVSQHRGIGFRQVWVHRTGIQQKGRGPERAGRAEGRLEEGRREPGGEGGAGQGARGSLD